MVAANAVCREVCWRSMENRPTGIPAHLGDNEASCYLTVMRVISKTDIKSPCELSESSLHCEE